MRANSRERGRGKLTSSTSSEAVSRVDEIEQGRRGASLRG